ncbi:MAG: bifunctional nuclease family protein [Phycisphaerae bacterium]|nr:bifunctional nuclease family protein [Phycisphaerae bacterium]
MDVPVELSRILITELGEQQVIFLREIGGDRTFPIMIGISEALAIDRRLKGVKFPRPLTHDLLVIIIEAMGGRLEKVVIDDLVDHTFYAKLHISRNGETVEVDARPSDAVALVASMDVPMFVNESIFSKAMQKDIGTKEDRINILRQRQTDLADSILEVSNMIIDEEFLSTAPPEEIDKRRRQLDMMQTEYQAIEEVLRKLG